jgi:hypothetical protein
MVDHFQYFLLLLSSSLIIKVIMIIMITGLPEEIIGNASKLYGPHKTSPKHDFNIDHDDITIPLPEDGCNLRAWHIPTPNADTCIVCIHGGMY